MVAETRQSHPAAFVSRWGPLLILATYLISTFGFLTVVPMQSSPTFIEAVTIILGVPATIILDIILVIALIVTCLAFNITFARILFASALDQRLPAVLARVNRYAAPAHATNIQVAVVVIVAVITYLVGPLLYLGSGLHFSSTVYDVTAGTIEVIWCLSMVILFLDLPILLRRFRGFFGTYREQLIAPRWVLYLCCVMGGIASLIGITASLSTSFDSQLISNEQWSVLVGGVVLASLVIGLLGSAYPRLLSSLNEQTTLARENARLYDELRTAYAKLSTLDQLKDSFLMTASHELRTPLTIVQGYLELLDEMKNADPEIRQEFLTKARRACDELVLLQANIMDASRIEFDMRTLHFTSIVLKEVCTGIVELFEPLIIQEKRQVEVVMDDALVVWADEMRLKQIIRNLIANALRYSPPQTPIRLSAVLEQEEGIVRINVMDYGAGVPREKQEAIFEKFVRLEREMHSVIRGSGLGLYITRQLVEAMGGTISVKSSGVA
jgi:signal transduction histidine kinase